MLEVGQSVGNYRITAKLGEGGMGVVFRAEHPIIARRAALKAIHPELASRPEIVSRFQDEAKAISQIGHEHIVDVSDFGRTPEGDLYLIMEHLEGEDLATAIRCGGPFAPARALAIAAQVADALSASHARGITHCDLKPENVYLITRGGTRDFVKVLDFGLAKLRDPNVAELARTNAGTIMGTPYYMAPEQCEGRSETDHRVDIYALGVMLFEMLTGRLPFGGESSGEILIKHVTTRPPAARALVPTLPEALDVILHRALAKDPNDRFRSMAAFRAALLEPGSAGETPEAGVLDDLTGRVRAARPMAREERRRGGRWWLAAAAAVATVALAFVGGRRARARRRAGGMGGASPVPRPQRVVAGVRASSDGVASAFRRATGAPRARDVARAAPGRAAVGAPDAAAAGSAARRR